MYVCVKLTRFALYLKLIVSWIKYVNNFLIKKKRKKISECNYLWEFHNSATIHWLHATFLLISDAKKNNLLRPLQAHRALLNSLFRVISLLGEHSENSRGRKLLKGLFHLDVTRVLGEHPKGLAHLSSSTGFLVIFLLSWVELCLLAFAWEDPWWKWSDVRPAKVEREQRTTALVLQWRCV